MARSAARTISTRKRARRGHALSVVGVPKTIDNDVGFVSRTFGFFSAIEEAARVLDLRAHRGAQRARRHRCS